MMPQGGSLSFGTLKLTDVPRWALALVALAVILPVGFGAWRLLYPDELIDAKAAAAALQASVEEYGQHIAETPEAEAVLWNDARGTLSVKTYADGCLLIARAGNSRIRSKLVVDLLRDANPMTRSDPPAPATPSDPGLGSADLVASVSAAERPWHPDLTPDQIAVTGGGKIVQPGCLNPHPGPFRTWYGEKRGCIVDVWREWPDGCQHSQQMDSCSGAWDSHPDGSPRVRWTRCVH
jgi:hypothetical protein